MFAAHICIASSWIFACSNIENALCALYVCRQLTHMHTKRASERAREKGINALISPLQSLSLLRPFDYSFVSKRNFARVHAFHVKVCVCVLFFISKLFTANRVDAITRHPLMPPLPSTSPAPPSKHKLLLLQQLHRARLYVCAVNKCHIRLRTGHSVRSNKYTERSVNVENAR